MLKKKPKSKGNPPLRPSKRRKRKDAKSSAIVKAQVVTPVVVEAGRRRELTSREIELIQHTVAKGTTPEQFSTFLWYCRKHEFDPLAKEVYCILFTVTKHHQDEKGIWCAGKEMVIITGIGGLRGKAARDHRDEYGSTDEPEYTFSGQKTPAGKLIPDTCTVRVWKKGAERPTAATLYWEEFAPRDLTDSRFEFWNKSPKNQLAKCAEAAALRKAYPDLTNIYVTEEVARRMSEETPGGRRIVDAPTSPSRDREIEAEVDRQKAGAVPSPQKAIAADLPHADAGKPPSISPPAKSQPAPQASQDRQFQGVVTLDWSGAESSPILRGDIANLTPLLEKHCHLKWAGDWWHCEPRDRETIKQICDQLSYRFIEILPKAAERTSGEFPAQTKSRVSAPLSSPENPAAQGRGAQAHTPGVPVADRITCRIERSITGMVGTRPVRDVTVLVNKKKPTYRCWDKNYFEAFDAGVGQEAILVLNQNKGFTNIARPVRIGKKQWDEQGLPILDVNREAGGKTLFP